jgi:hypothetical protein
MPKNRFLAITLFLAFLPGAQAEATLLDQGYRQMYNLQFDQAHRSFQDWEQLHPEDPLGFVSDAAAYLFSEFDRLQILQAELFANNRTFLSRQTSGMDPRVKEKFDSALDKGRQLADRTLDLAPQDQNAMLAAILGLGLHADYLALIEKRYLTSLSEMKSARMLAEKLLASDPKCYDAYLAIGVENYLLSLKPAPIRWALRIDGAETDKQEGIAKLGVTAEKGRYLLPYARLLLAFAALRDKDSSRASELLRELAAEFPRNTLYAQELARLK